MFRSLSIHRGWFAVMEEEVKVQEIDIPRLLLLRYRRTVVVALVKSSDIDRGRRTRSVIHSISREARHILDAVALILNLVRKVPWAYNTSPPRYNPFRQALRPKSNSSIYRSCKMIPITYDIQLFPNAANVTPYPVFQPTNLDQRLPHRRNNATLDQHPRQHRILVRLLGGPLPALWLPETALVLVFALEGER